MNSSAIFQHRINWRLEIGLTIASLLLTLIASCLLLSDLVSPLIDHHSTSDMARMTEQAIFLVIVLSLVYGGFVYQITRLGLLFRDQAHNKRQGWQPDAMNQHLDDSPLTILIPSYKEEVKVIHQTLMSAALQLHPNKRIVLLLDDPPQPLNQIDSLKLLEARKLPQKVLDFLEIPRSRFESAFKNFLQQEFEPRSALAKLTAEFDYAAEYLKSHWQQYRIEDHTDHLFTEKVLKEASTLHADQVKSLKKYAWRPDQTLQSSQIENGYRFLLAAFTADIQSFERKQYNNLSHEVNKAMNINTYLALMGHHWRVNHGLGEKELHQCPRDLAEFSPAAATFIITLDADSLIVPDYAVQLLHFMQQPGNEHIAVVQTPYSAIPGAKNPLERVSGATTDIQLLTHQGFTWCNSTFWVGANALLRTSALNDIRTIDYERGHQITRFIQDRTVIEETESSIDLINRGWSLYNFPARLAYSATPADYGSLLIQRRRWANGGLIILPKLLSYTARKPNLRKFAECFVRMHYLISIAVASVGVLALLLYPFESILMSVWLPLTALPYFYLYGRDLKLSGYSWMDLPKVYCLNLILLPVNLGGVLKSIEQGLTGKKTPFVRTPKVGDRTAAPALYHLSTIFLLIYCLSGMVLDALNERWITSSFAGINGLFFFYGISRFIGWKNCLIDLRSSLTKLRSSLKVRKLAADDQ